MGSNQVIRLFAFAGGLLLGGCFTVAFAESIPATNTQYPTTQGYQWNSTNYASTTAACAAAPVNPTAVPGDDFQFYDPSHPVNFKCMSGGSLYGYGAYVYKCSGGTQNTSAWQAGVPVCSSALSCPVGGNWTLSGSNCTRPDCVAGMPPPVGGINGVTDAMKAKKACIAGCQYGVGAVCIQLKGDTTQGCTVGNNTGQACDANTSGIFIPAGIPACPIGKCSIFLNGVQTCVTCGTGGTDPIVKSTATKTTTAADGSKAVQTTTTNYDPGVTGGGTGSGGGAGSGGATNTTTSTQNFDPAGTATGTTTQTEDALPEPEKTDCEKEPDKIACMKVGTVTDDVQPPEKTNQAFNITPVSLGGSGSCPGDVALPHGAAFSWAPMCMYASGLRPIIIALAWLAAGSMVLLSLKGS